MRKSFLLLWQVVDQPNLRRCRIKPAVTVVTVSVGGGWKAAALPRIAALRIAVYEGWAKIEEKPQISPASGGAGLNRL